jgi:hypothetical protein
MSSDVFKYINVADYEQLTDINLQVSQCLQQGWKQRLQSEQAVKFDDVGDALLHALNDTVNGSSTDKQLLAPKSSLHDNTVALSVFPDTVYRTCILCSWNCFMLKILVRMI